ncbi:hypothetical protein BXZ70DRAFT_1004736 [Cristinia sonorae]|uniref:Senescence domain-containing protein n=1 Tax=Cristinia sonorae TaxID=1940300 RepID=A0A8K0UXE9_9AGAR|nr:hypothetical protein BXZ70DRAFT_1004736 [Cristinia sonorae]
MSSQTLALTIPNVTATHVVAKSEVELGKGDLTLITAQPPPTQPHAVEIDESAPVLALTVGKAAFQLFKSTDFGTLAGDDRVYVFSPQVGEKVGYVKITLPFGVKEEGSELAKLQEQFEKILVDFGLLKDGVAATGDNIGRTVQEHAGNAARMIRGGTTAYLDENPPTQHPATFTETTHSIASSSASATGSMLAAATTVSTAVGNAASAGGAWLTARTIPTTDENTDTLNQLGDAYASTTGGFASGVQELTDSVSESASRIVENEWGREAREVGGELAGSVGNVGGVVGQAAGVASGASVVGGGLRGAVAMENKQLVEKEKESGVEPGEVRQTSGHWQEIPV